MIQKKKDQDYPRKRVIHRFGYQYSQTQKRPIFFSQTGLTHSDCPEDLLFTYQKYSQILEERLARVKDILVRLLQHEDQNSVEEPERSIEDLLEQLLLMILQKEEENHSLKRHNQVLKAEIVQYLKNEGSECSSRQIQDSRVAIDMSQPEISEKAIHYYELHNIRQHQQNLQMYRNSQESTKTRSMYRPHMLFELGKEVSTINEMNSEQIVSDINAYSKNNSRQPSFKELLKFKKNQNRMSIERSIPKGQTGQPGVNACQQGYENVGFSENISEAVNEEYQATTEKMLSVKKQRFSKKYNQNDLRIDKKYLLRAKQIDLLSSK